MAIPFFSALKKFLTKDNKKESDRTESFAAGQAGAVGAKSEAAASDAMDQAMDDFTEMYYRMEDKGTTFRRGHLFETIVEARENTAQALEGSDKRMFVTHLEGDHTAPADLKLRNTEGEKVFTEVQTKFSTQEPNEIIEMINQEKYEGMELYIPSDKVEPVREELLKRAQNASTPQEKARYADLADRIKDNDISIDEVEKADSNPEKYAQANKNQSALAEVKATATKAAVAGAVVGGGISAIKNTIAVSQGEKDIGDAAKEVSVDAAKSGAKSGTVGAGGAVVRQGAKKAGVKMLQKSNIATAVAASTVEIGKTVYNLAKGDISAEEAMEEIGQTGTSTASGIYSGAVAGMTFGPVGAAVGSVAGYIAASGVYQSCLSILKEAKLTEKEAERVIAIYEEATEQLRKERQEFEKLIEERLEIRQDKFNECFAKIDNGLESSNFEEVNKGLANFANVFGEKMEFETFEEFDEFMKNSDKSLTL